MIKFYKLPYTLRKDYLTKVDEVNMGIEFENFVAERGEVSAQEIKANFVSFCDYNVTLFLMRCPKVIYIGDEKYMYASRLNIQDHEIDSIKNFLNQNCSTPVNSRVLIEMFFEKFSNFMEQNEIYSHDKLFGILKYMFSEDFNFSRPYISTTDIKNISNKRVLLSLLEGRDKIEIEDLISIAEENKIHFIAKSNLIESFYPEFIRIDEITLARPESIGVTSEIISAVLENIQSAIERNDGWQSAQSFDDYEWLPQLEISWNSFLLESVASLAGDVLYKLKMATSYQNFSTAIFVSEEFAEDDFQTFVLKILKVEHNKEPFSSEKEILEWLNTRGLYMKKLPKFLVGRALTLLSEY